MNGDWRDQLLKFWFSLEPQQWWHGGPTLDHLIRQKFLKLWFLKRQLPVEALVGDPLTALAAAILFDQFPRNMFAGTAEQFATDHLALAISKAALLKGFGEALEPQERCFLYMPLEHSEKLDDQNRSVQLFTQLGNQDWLGYARKHRDIVQRFGRFPHRNRMLGRAPRPDEIAAGDVVPW